MFFEKLSVRNISQLICRILIVVLSLGILATATTSEGFASASHSSLWQTADETISPLRGEAPFTDAEKRLIEERREKGVAQQQRPSTEIRPANATQILYEECALYGTDGANLYIIDKVSGGATLIGPHGPVEYFIGAIAFDSSGTLYGISAGSSAQLYTIDPSTGAASAIGPLGIGFVFEGGLAIDSADVIYGVDQGGASDARTFQINSSTGAASIIGPSPGDQRDINGLAFDGNTLYAIDRVSNAFGTVAMAGGYTPIGNTGDTVGSTGGLAIDPTDGTAYASFMGTGGFYTIDKGTGTATLIAINNVDFGLTFAPGCKLQCAIPPSGMVAWYPFDDEIFVTDILSLDVSTSPFVWDIYGLHNGTKENGPTTVPGMVEEALQFNGVDQFVNVPHNADFNFGTGDFSFDSWVRFPSGHSGIHPILQKHNSSGLLNGYHWFVKDGEMALQMTSSGTAQVYFSGVSLINDGQWHLLAVTVDRGVNGGRWYIDGNEVGTPFTPLSGSINNNAPLQLAKYTTIPTGEYHLNGILDEVEIFDRALSDSDIADIYDAGENGKCKDPCPYLAAISQNEPNDDSSMSDAVRETRELRDKVWSESAAGRRLTAVYNQHSDRVTSLLLRDAELRSQVAKVLRQLRPAIRSLTTEDREQFMISEDLAESVLASLAYLQEADVKNDGGMLAEAIEKELSITNPKELVGLSAEAAWSQVVQQYDRLAEKEAESEAEKEAEKSASDTEISSTLGEGGIFSIETDSKKTFLPMINR